MDYSSLDNHIELFDALLGPEQAKNRETRFDYNVGRDSRPDSLRPGREFYRVEITTRNANFNPVRFSWFYHSVKDRSGWFMTSLSLRGMGLAYLDFGILNKLSELEYLDLQGNRIKNFNTSKINRKEKLHTLNLSSNNLQSFSIDTSAKFPNLRMINLENNNLNHIDTALFEENHELNRFIVSNNQLEELNLSHLGELPHLFTIDVSNNDISTLEAILYNPDLTSLLIQNNEIDNFEIDGNLPSLRFLGIYENYLCEFDFTKIAKIAPNLKKIFLWGNRIKKLNLHLERFHSIEEINASGNMIEEIKLSNCTNGLQVLNLSYNQVKTFDMTNLPNSVETIDLRYNPLRELKFQFKPNLKNLDLSGTKLDSINLERSKIDSIMSGYKTNRVLFYADQIEIRIPDTVDFSK